MARPGLRMHPKFRLLVHLLNIPEAHVWGLLEMVWESSYQSGNPVLGTSIQVEMAAGWTGERGVLTKALMECKGTMHDHGFIKTVEGKEDCYQVHDLMQNAPAYVQKRFAREEERCKKGKDISCIRSEAAKARWDKRKRPMQTESICIRSDANGMQTDALPTPISQHPSPINTPPQGC
jgi:hypothetical protein